MAKCQLMGVICPFARCDEYCIVSTENGVGYTLQTDKIMRMYQEFMKKSRDVLDECVRRLNSSDTVNKVVVKDWIVNRIIDAFDIYAELAKQFNK